MIPSHGFRHAAALLLTSSVRAIPLDATPETVSDALSRLAADLVGLADDMRMSPEAKDWLIGEYERTIARLPHSFDAGAARRNAADVLARAGTRESRREPRDLFLIYVPEDRLPVAAPLAIELTKRRVSVALSEFEVTTPEELAAAVEHGLDLHRAGVVLWTRAFERSQLQGSLHEGERLRILDNPQDPATAADLAAWFRTLEMGRQVIE